MATGAASKKARTLEVVKLSLDEDKLVFEALSTDMMYNLIALICDNTCIGDGEGADDHFWDVKVNNLKITNSCSDGIDRKKKEEVFDARKTKLNALDLVKGLVMDFEYDYDDYWGYFIKVEELRTLKDDETENDFPRIWKLGYDSLFFLKYTLSHRIQTSANIFIPLHTGMPLYKPEGDVNVDAMFPAFNNWLFGASARNMRLNMFQP